MGEVVPVIIDLFNGGDFEGGDKGGDKEGVVEDEGDEFGR